MKKNMPMPQNPHDEPKTNKTRVPLRVLIVEDLADDAELLLMELRRGGWNVIHERVDSAPAMIDALDSAPWDIIISDYSMPSFSGVAALAIARERASDLPFILVSATVGEEIAVQAMKTGANDYMFKGNLKRLAPAVDREMREAQIRREARHTERELRKREGQLADAQRIARLGSWHYDADKDAVSGSDEVYRICGLGLSKTGVSFESFVGCLDSQDRKLLVDTFNSPGMKRFAHDCRLTAAEGEERYAHLGCDIIRDPEGKVLWAAGMIQEITERKLVEKELRDAHTELATAKETADAANHAKDQFLAVLSHELRTPLTPVLLTISLLENNPRLSQDVRDDLQVVRRHVQLEARLIDDLLDSTRIARGVLRLNFETADAHQLIRNAMDICCPDRARDITLALEATQHHVQADPARFLQIFWNLLSNATKFTPNGKPIVIRSSNFDDGRIRIEVLDSGVGIEPAKLPRIFNAFEPGDSSLTRNFAGLGLGLSIVKGLVEAHGGIITARSDGKGKGAAFAVEMATVPQPRPHSHSRPARKPPESSLDAVAQRLRILLVEDHEGTLAMMIRLLTQLGHEVKSAATMKDALKLAETESIDLLISDLGLPDGSGHDLMRQLQTRSPLRGIAVSGFGMDEDLRKSCEAGFVRHLIKPIDMEKLQLAIQQAVS